MRLAKLLHEEEQYKYEAQLEKERQLLKQKHEADMRAMELENQRVIHEEQLKAQAARHQLQLELEESRAKERQRIEQERAAHELKESNKRRAEQEFRDSEARRVAFLRENRTTTTPWQEVEIARRSNKAKRDDVAETRANNIAAKLASLKKNDGSNRNSSGADNEDKVIEVNGSDEEEPIPEFDPMQVVMEARLFIAADNPKMQKPVEVLQRKGAETDQSYAKLLTPRNKRVYDTDGRVLHHSRSDDFFRWLYSMNIENTTNLRSTHQQLLVDEEIAVEGLVAHADYVAKENAVYEANAEGDYDSENLFELVAVLEFARNRLASAWSLRTISRSKIDVVLMAELYEWSVRYVALWSNRERSSRTIVSNYGPAIAVSGKIRKPMTKLLWYSTRTAWNTVEF